jgi:CubicO group peptidase (beta-lactamase class C family)
MKKLRLVTIILIACCAFSRPTRAQSPASPTSSSSASSASPTPAFITDSLDAYIAEGMKDWQLPGLSIVIVKDGKIVWMKGYGVRNIVSKEPVTENTLFMIASNTKLFTATSLAQLEYEKKLSLDDKFTKYFPDYKLYEPGATDMLTIKDLLCHRIGTKTFQGDFTFWNSRLSREEIMKKMRLLKPSAAFRDKFGYCNSCFLSAGQIIPKITNKSWEDYVQDSILDPLQMKSTYTSITKIRDQATIATPYTTSYLDSLIQTPFDQWDNLGPAASLLSNVSDLSHWLLFQLDSGRYNGTQVMPFAILRRTREMNTVISSRKSPIYPTHFAGYGLGLFMEDYNGRQEFFHTGGAAGMVSIVSFVPEERLGIAILTNNDNQELFTSLRNQILDAYLGVPYQNRSKFFLKGSKMENKFTVDQINAWKARVSADSSPTLPLASYAGHYTHPLYGSMDIRVKGRQLALVFNGHEHLTAALSYMDKDEWMLRYDNIEYGIFSTKFMVAQGKVVSLLSKENPFVEIDPYTFVKD